MYIMKKSKSNIAFVAVFIMMLGYTLYSATNKKDMSNLLLDNIEALASDEAEKTKCYGPKSNSECQCTNATPCSDNSGC